MVEIKIKRIDANAIIPEYAHKGDAGFDLRYVGEPYSIKPGEKRVFGTGLQFEIPTGYEMQIRPRSGLAAKHGITVLNAPGTIDSTYRGEVGVILINHGDNSYLVERGEKIAQGVVKKLEEVVLTEVGELSETKRGSDGFGSTGS